jgi:phage baseplate assembly protein W
MDWNTSMRAMSYPFTISSSGKILATTDTNKVYMDRALTLIATLSGQRPMRYTYGVNYEKGLYENNNNVSVGLQEAIREALGKWLPDVSIVSYGTSPAGEDGVATISLNLRFPDGTVDELSTRMYTLSEDGTITR